MPRFRTFRSLLPGAVLQHSAGRLELGGAAFVDHRPARLSGVR